MKEWQHGSIREHEKRGKGEAVLPSLKYRRQIKTAFLDKCWLKASAY